MGDECLERVYVAMRELRCIDEHLEMLQRQGRIGFHVGAHGEEAAVVASAAALGDRDWIVPCYRELGALLWRGFPLQLCLDNVFANSRDAAKGRQMPDHYTAKAYRYASVSSPVGTQLPHAVGMAWGLRYQGKQEVVAVYFGDGATSANGFHAAMNLAGVRKLPVLFLCRNNQWAISVPLREQTAVTSLADKGAAYGVYAERRDGNDAFAVYDAVRRARRRALAGEGPTLLELVTYRTGGHSTSDDPRVYRSNEEFEAWRQRCPIARLRRHLESQGQWDDSREQELVHNLRERLRQAVTSAESAAPPALQSLVDDVYAEVPWHLREQLEELAADEASTEAGA